MSITPSLGSEDVLEDSDLEVSRDGVESICTTKNPEVCSDYKLSADSLVVLLFSFRKDNALFLSADSSAKEDLITPAGDPENKEDVPAQIKKSSVAIEDGFGDEKYDSD